MSSEFSEAHRSWTGSEEEFRYAFRYQYLVTEETEDVPGFIRHPIGRHVLWRGEGLNAAEVKDNLGAVVGILIGKAVNQGKLIQGSLTLPFSGTGAFFKDQAVEFVTHLAGRFGFFVTIDDNLTLFTDPIGMIGAVYNKTARRLASSAYLTLKRPPEHNPLFDEGLIKGGKGRYTLFHTSDVDVLRMNPSFSLNLESFEVQRFWPRNEVFSSSLEDHLGIYDEIIETTSENIGAIAHASCVALPLSGGQDTRLLASMAGVHMDQIDLTFSHITNTATRIDAVIANIVAKKLGVSHEKHFRTHEADELEKNQTERDWFRVTSGSPQPPPVEYLNGCYRSLPDGAVVLRGHVTDLLRAVFHYRFSEGSQSRFRWQIRFLLTVPLSDFDDRQLEKFLPTFIEWRETLPDSALGVSVDFLFLEVFYPSSLGQLFPALWRNFYLSPYNSRRLIELSLKLDIAYRKHSFPVNDIVQNNSLTLARIPFDYELSGSPSERRASVKNQGNRLELTRNRREQTAKRLAELKAYRRTKGA